jgi:peptide/nickel transport system permease protein
MTTPRKSWRYLVARLGGTLGTLAGVAILVFLVLRALPGDAVTARLGTEAGVLTDQQLAALERYYGLDQPLWQQFTSWLGSVLTGNFGVSVASGEAVAGLMWSALPVTVELAVLSILISTPIGVALGVYAATRPGKAGDVGVQSIGLVGLALPEFVTASVVVAILASTFSYFPDPGTYVPITESVAGNLSQMLYPALVLSVGLVATVMRTTRSAYLEAANTDYVRTARGKGLAPRRIRLRHVLHNASIPILTIVGIQFGYLLGGTVIIEQVFALPGLGRLLLNGILQQDYAVVQSTVLLVAVAFVLVNLVVDLTYRLLDPRARLR